MSDQVYDVLKDLVVPGLSGIGAILVGIGAVAVALRVRDDEHEREQAASRQRYRDQLFRTIEPAVTALLDQRAAIDELRKTGVAPARNPVPEVMSRMNMLDAVVNSEDRRMVHAVLDAYEAAIDRKDLAILRYVLGGLALGLPQLLLEHRDVTGLVQRTEGLLEEAIQENTPKT